MLSFGFIPDPATDIGIIIPNGKEIVWQQGGPQNEFKYNHAMALKLMGWFDRFNNDEDHMKAWEQYIAWS